MPIKWMEGKYASDKADVGVIRLNASYGMFKGDGYVAEIPAFGIRVKGLPDMDAAKSRAESELRKALEAAIKALGPASKEGA